MNFQHPVSITVRRSGGRDPRTQDPLPASEHGIDGCAWAPRYASETTGGGNTTITGLSLFVPYGADIRADDVVLLPGDDRVWEVDGEPGDWRNPFTDWRPGTEVALKRQEG